MSERTSAILREDPEGPCVDLIAVRAIDKDKAWVKALVEAHPSRDVKECVLERIKGSVLPGW